MEPRFRYWVYPFSQHGPLLVDLSNGKVVGKVVTGGFQTVSWKAKHGHRTVRDAYTKRVWHVQLPNEKNDNQWQSSFQKSAWGSIANVGIDIRKFELPGNVPPFFETKEKNLIHALNILRNEIPKGMHNVEGLTPDEKRKWKLFYENS